MHSINLTPDLIQSKPSYDFLKPILVTVCLHLTLVFKNRKTLSLFLWPLKGTQQFKKIHKDTQIHISIDTVYTH